MKYLETLCRESTERRHREVGVDGKLEGDEKVGRFTITKNPEVGGKRRAVK